MAGYQVGGLAPSMENQPAGTGVGFSVAEMNAMKQPLPTIQQSVSGEALKAGRVAARASVEAASIVNETLANLSTLTGEQTASIARKAEADVAAEKAKRQRDVEMAALAREKYGLTLGDLSDPNALGNQMAVQIRDVALQRQALGERIREQQSIDITERPFDWLVAQFTTSGLINEYNTLAVQQNGMQADAQALQQVSNNLIDAQRAGIPAQTLDEHHAALVAIEETAAQRKLEAEMQLQVNRNAAARSTAELLQSNYGTLMGMDDRRRQVELNNINQLQEAVRWDATRQTRLYQELRAQSANAAEISVRRMEMAMGLQPGTGNALLDNKSIPQEHRDMLLRFAFTGSIDTPEQAVAISRYANRQMTEAGEAIGDSKIVRMSDTIVQAQQLFNTDASARQKAGSKISQENWKKMSDADRSLEFSKHIRSFVTGKISKDVVSMTPYELSQMNSNVAVAFPELTMYINGGSAMEVSNEGIASAFLAAAGGNPTAAAKRIAAYNQTKLQVVTDSTALKQAGFEAPTKVVSQAAYPGVTILGMGGAPNSMPVDWTSTASVERYLRVREAAKKNPYSDISQYKE